MSHYDRLIAEQALKFLRIVCCCDADGISNVTQRKGHNIQVVLIFFLSGILPFILRNTKTTLILSF